MKKVISLTAAAVALSALGHGAALAADATDGLNKTLNRFTPPDRLSVDRNSPHYDDCYRRVRVWLNDVERMGDVQEYCVSEGWIDVRKRGAGGKFMTNGDGTYALERLTGTVEVAFKPTPKPVERDHQSEEQARAALDAAAAKRARKAAKLKKQMGG
jgi:hypothetical protein